MAPMLRSDRFHAKRPPQAPPDLRRSPHPPPDMRRSPHPPPDMSGPPPEDLPVNVKNDWDLLAEAIVGLGPEHNIPLDHLIIALKSRGVVVHQIPRQSAMPSAIPSQPIMEPPANCTNGVTSAATKEVHSSNSPNTGRLFPRDVAFICGTRVIEAPPSSLSENRPQPEHVDALFELLERMGADVVRWPAASVYDRRQGRTPEGNLIDFQEGSEQPPQYPMFSPSDVVILSPTLIITRLSARTNDEGLGYLQSMLCLAGDYVADRGPRPPKLRIHRYDPSMTGPRILPVDIIDSDRPAGMPPGRTCPILFPDPSTSPAAQAAVPKSGSTGYIPLCQALVPINRRTLLYDPALVADHEVEKLQDWLDRDLEEADMGDRDIGDRDMSADRAGKDLKRKPRKNYGTFKDSDRRNQGRNFEGSNQRNGERAREDLDQRDDEGWQLIPVEGLHATSILLASPAKAMLSPALGPSPPGSVSIPSTWAPLFEKALNNVSRELESLGVESMPLKYVDLAEWQGGGVRDTILVLRRYSEELDPGSPDDEQQGSQCDDTNPNPNPSGGEEDQAVKGCMGAVLGWVIPQLLNLTPYGGIILSCWDTVVSCLQYAQTRARGGAPAAGG